MGPQKAPALFARSLLPCPPQGSWLLFGFEITTPFVVGVGLVILSIFIYGSKPEQTYIVRGWGDAKGVTAKLRKLLRKEGRAVRIGSAGREHSNRLTD